MLYNWSGAAYRSPQMDVAPVTVLGCWPIVIERNFRRRGPSRRTRSGRQRNGAARLRDPLFDVFEHPVVLRIGNALLCRLAIPFRRFGTILRHTLALRIHEPQIELRRAVALFGCFEKPLHCFGFVFCHALPLGECDAETCLRLSIAFLSFYPQFIARL